MISPATAVAAPHISEKWRSSTARLIVIYGAFFVAWTVLLVAIIHWQTAHYLETVVDQILEQRIQYLATVEREKLPATLAMTGAIDLRGVMSFGEFDANGRYMAGNIDRLPQDLPADGRVHLLPDGVQRINGERTGHSRGVAIALGDGVQVVLARSTSVIDRVGVLIRNGLFWALSLSFVPGLLGGFLLSRGPLQRVRRIETAIAPIMRGDLGARVPVSGRRDELDMLASIVNRMLDRIEHLLGEVKGVSDAIAHDLRTPLTRLRAQLYRVQQQGEAQDPRTATIESCIVDVDTLLDRFRALLRISELEDFRRRAGFGAIDLHETLDRVHELYAPLAEDKGVNFPAARCRRRIARSASRWRSAVRSAVQPGRQRDQVHPRAGHGAIARQRASAGRTHRRARLGSGHRSGRARSRAAPLLSQREWAHGAWLWPRPVDRRRHRQAARLPVRDREQCDYWYAHDDPVLVEIGDSRSSVRSRSATADRG